METTHDPALCAECAEAEYVRPTPYTSEPGDVPTCVAGTDHGDCGLEANYAFIESDRTTYACAFHVRRIGNDMLDYASEFTYRVLNP